MPALHGATLSTDICSTCKSLKLAKEWVEAITIYKMGPSPHRARESEGERENTHSSIYCMALKSLQPFYVDSRVQKRLHKSPYWTDGVLNCSQAAPLTSEPCTCVLHEERCSLSATGYNKTSTEQLKAATWGGVAVSFDLEMCNMLWKQPLVFALPLQILSPHAITPLRISYSNTH